MKRLKEILESIDNDNQEELGMIVGNLRSIAINAKEIEELMSQSSDAEEWVQEKIAVAAASIESVAKYLKHNPRN